MLGFIAAAASLAAVQGSSPTIERTCGVGAYKSATGSILSIIKRDKGYRYYFLDGRFGDPLDKSSGVLCEENSVRVLVGQRMETWSAVPIHERAVSFVNAGANLKGILLEPTGVRRPPLVVLAHGGERSGWIGHMHFPYTLAGQGISVFVYDKRGTGLSGGKYTQSLHLLSADLAAASATARKMVQGRFSAFGLAGFSQGGWVAPRAALRIKPDFMMISFGGVFSPLEEDAEQVRLELIKAGFGPAAIGKAREVTAATGEIMRSHFRRGYARLRALRRQYGDEPWFTKIQGEFSGQILARSEADLRRRGRLDLDDLGLEWDYDSMAVLRRLHVPILWILAGEDRDSPIGLTTKRVRALQSEGKPIQLVTFPRTDHGIVEFEEAPDGTRTPTRFADGFFRLLGEWPACRVSPPYGSAKFQPKLTNRMTAFSWCSQEDLANIQ